MDEHIFQETKSLLAASANKITESNIITKVTKCSRKIMFFAMQGLCAIAKP